MDHRTRVGQHRRARTRRQIIGAALTVFAEKGPDAPVIDDFVLAAGVARGTFYNYFSSTRELLDVVTRTLEDDLMRATLGAMAAIDDPVLRLATGVRLWLHWSRQDRTGCAFVVRSRFRGPLVEKQVAADLVGGLNAGQFSFPSIKVARDLLIGSIREAMSRVLESRVSAAYLDDVARTILRGLGMDRRSADRLVSRPLPKFRAPKWSPSPGATGTSSPR